jgi:sugar-specific transcriptional regulator TrmB
MLSVSQRAYLDEIGLSKEAVRLYELLLQKGQLSAQAAATYTLDHPSAEYRLFYALEAKDLVRRLAGRPRQFEALPLGQGLQASFVDKQFELKQLLGSAVRPPQPEQGDAVLVGRQALYRLYIKLARHAQHEICVYSIGIAYSRVLEQTQVAAVRRGVRIRHVVQERKVSNYHIIHKWQRAGVKLRHLQRSRGYHLTIIDNTHAIVTFSDPADTEQRISLVTTHSAAVDVLQAQFDQLWSESRPVSS